MKPNGAIFYRGPSLITGKPIIGIITGLRRGSANSKTGKMLQTWILCANVDPVTAIKSGKDVDICGDCPHRGDHGVARSCYVTVVQAPRAVYATFKRGGYKRLETSQVAGRILRIGSYGDPAAIPVAVWEGLLAATGERWTGYTHQWHTTPDAFKSFLMASVDSEWERGTAAAAGWRTFRVRDSVAPLDRAQEISCPASAEMNHRVTCADCNLCQGTASGAKSIAILPHGTSASNIIALSTLRSAIAQSSLRKVA